MIGKQIVSLIVACVFLIGGYWATFRTRSLQDFLYRESVSGVGNHNWPRNLNSIYAGWNYYLMKAMGIGSLIIAILVLWAAFFKRS